MARHTTAREKRKARIRKKLTGTTERPRLTVYRSLKHIYAQVVDDVTGRTLVCAGSTSKALEDSNQEANQVAAATEESAKVVAAVEESDKVVAASEEGKMDASEEGKKTAAKAKEGKKKAAAKAKEGKKVSAATRVGTAVAKAALEKGIKQVVFDRNGFDYHGRIAAVAEAARKAGLQF